MIGTGIFTTTGFWRAIWARRRWVVVDLGGGAVCAFHRAQSAIRSWASIYPSSGGEYVYLTEASGPPGLHDRLGMLSSPVFRADRGHVLRSRVTLGYFFPSVLPDNAPAIAGHGDWTFRLGGAQWIACVLIALFTILNVVGVRVLRECRISSQP